MHSTIFFTKFGGKVAHWPRKKPLDLGGNPDHVTGCLHGTIVGPTGRSERSVRLVGPTIVSCKRFDRSDRRSEESNMFDFVRLSKRVDTTSDWSDRLASRKTNHAAA